MEAGATAFQTNGDRIIRAGGGNIARIFQMATTQQVYNFLKTKRELNIDTLKSTIPVNQDYSDFVESLADDLGIDECDCLEIFQELEALEYIFCMPQADSWIDYIKIDG